MFVPNIFSINANENLKAFVDMYNFYFETFMNRLNNR